jgi:tetratricopeptide (TPR) repeat protein
MHRLLSISFVSILGVSSAMAGDAKVSGSAQVTIQADVNAKAKAQAAAGDAAYAAGKFEAALAVYGEGFAQTRDAAFIYAIAQTHKAMGHKDEAKVMFETYLSASGDAAAKYKANVEAELGIKAKSAATKLVGGVKDTAKVVVNTSTGIYSAAKVSLEASIDAKAKAEAKAADTAYAAAKYEEASTQYLAAYAKSQSSVALYGAAQAKAQAGKGAEARGLLLGYIAAQPNGKYAKDSKALLLAIGGDAKMATKVTVKGKVDASAKAEATTGDAAFAAGKFSDAATAYAAAYAKKSDAALLYAKGVAQLYAGQTADAVTTLKAYLAAGGKLEFQASAEAHLRAGGAA